MSSTQKRFCQLHREFLHWTSEDVYYATVTTVPFYEANRWKEVLWAEFEHIAITYYCFKPRRAKKCFNLLMHYFNHGLVTYRQKEDDLKDIFLRLSRRFIHNDAIG